MGTLRRHAAYHLFRTLPVDGSRAYDLLLPSPSLSREIDRYQRFLPANYTAVHRRTNLRNMYLCKDPPTAADGGDSKNHTKPPFCEMRVPYIRQAQLETGHSVTEKIFLATDNIYAHPGANASFVRYVGRHQRTAAVVVDFFLMARSGLFLGNPSSSLAMNVCLFRRAMRPPRPCHHFRFCYERPAPYLASWPCGAPLPSLSTEL
eukprot:RCo017385